MATGTVLQAFDESDCWFSLDETALDTLEHFAFSTEVDTFVEGRAPFVETILNRPPRHFAHLPAEMLFKFDLIPEATQDLEGQCAKMQLLYCARRRNRENGADHRNGERVWARDEDIEPLLDEIEHSLYPSRYEGEAPSPGGSSYKL